MQQCMFYTKHIQLYNILILTVDINTNCSMFLHLMFVMLIVYPDLIIGDLDKVNQSVVGHFKSKGVETANDKGL